MPYLLQCHHGNVRPTANKHQLQNLKQVTSHLEGSAESAAGMGSSGAILSHVSVLLVHTCGNKGQLLRSGVRKAQTHMQTQTNRHTRTLEKEGTSSLMLHSCGLAPKIVANESHNDDLINRECMSKQSTHGEEGTREIKRHTYNTLWVKREEKKRLISFHVLPLFIYLCTRIQDAVSDSLYYLPWDA